MSQLITDITTILKQSGHSLTNPRKLVFEILMDHDALSMSDLRLLTQKDMDRASLYRTIVLFEELRIVSRINIGWKYKIELSDKFRDHHHHLTCLGCGKTELLEDSENLEIMLANLASDKGYVISGHQLDIQGLCPSCINKKDPWP